MREKLKDILRQAELVQSNVRRAHRAVRDASTLGPGSSQSIDALEQAKKAQREALLVEGLLSSLIDRTFHHGYTR